VDDSIKLASYTVAYFFGGKRLASTQQSQLTGPTPKVWADIENAPQVLALAPILKELERQGFAARITARDFGQTFDLLRLHGLAFSPVGCHAGPNLFRKGTEIMFRSFNLWRAGRHHDFRVAVSCGARGSLLPARLLGIPLITLIDYEHVFAYPFIKLATRILTPDVIPDENLCGLGYNLRKVRKFPGLKEELYVFDFEPDSATLHAAGIDFSHIVAAVRPPATMAHYHSAKSEEFFWMLLDHLLGQPDVQTVVLPRTQSQEQWIRTQIPPRSNLLIPKNVVHGPNLLWHVDAMFGGGGTMTREAACLGVPAYSFFGGLMGAVDRHLHAQGKLIFVQNASQINQIRLQKLAPRGQPPRDSARRVLHCILENVLEVALNQEAQRT
jgi:predicted glycosyltransferase